MLEDIKNKDLEIFKSLENEDFKIIKIHDGKWEWDSFIAFLRE